MQHGCASLSADKLCKQVGSRPGPMCCHSDDQNYLPPVLKKKKNEQKKNTKKSANDITLHAKNLVPFSYDLAILAIEIGPMPPDKSAPLKIIFLIICCGYSKEPSQ